MAPKDERLRGELNGTSFATGSPYFVTTYSTPVSRTRSISSRHLALKFAADTYSSGPLGRGGWLGFRLTLPSGMTTILWSCGTSVNMSAPSVRDRFSASALVQACISAVL